jgi:ADP-ribose pyrophosphatase
MKKPPYPFTVEVIDQQTAFEGFYRLDRYQLKQKDWSGNVWSLPFNRELIIKKPVSVVLAHDPKRDVFLLLQQFRMGTLLVDPTPPLFECVAGIVDEGETPLMAAHRELEEEAGVSARSMTEVMAYWVSPGGCTEHVTLFYATVDARDAPDHGGNASEHELIQVHALPVEEAFVWMEKGWINNSATLIALMWFRLNPQLTN